MVIVNMVKLALCLSRHALRRSGCTLPTWRLHRRIAQMNSADICVIIAGFRYAHAQEVLPVSTKLYKHTKWLVIHHCNYYTA